MCKVVKYWFACHHGFRLRHSKCGGTKHKNTRSGWTTACKSEPYLHFLFTINCGPCQHLAFEDSWKQKLKLAVTFLENLKKKDLPGVQKVDALVEQLEDDFNTATWDTRALFPHAHKQQAVRVSLGCFEKLSSPLCHEVLPKDIPVPPGVIGPEHPDYTYDWDYVASTDPMHPVDTNYAHPLDEVDPSWMLNHLSPEEFEQSGEGFGFDANEADATWAGNLAKLYMDATDWSDNMLDQTSEATRFCSKNIEPSRASEESARAALASNQVEICTQDERLLAERVNMVIHEFWRLVNGDNSVEHSSQDVAFTVDRDVDDSFEGLYISDPLSDSETPQTGLLTPPRTPIRFSTDGNCDLNFLTLSPPEDSASLPSVSVDTQSPSSNSYCSNINAKLDAPFPR